MYAKFQGLSPKNVVDLVMDRFVRGVGVPHGYGMVKAWGAMRHEEKKRCKSMCHIHIKYAW